MAKILEFRPAESKPHDGERPAAERVSAEVVVFPGVRYEHWEEGPAASQDGAASRPMKRRRRDVLELAE